MTLHIPTDLVELRLAGEVLLVRRDEVDAIRERFEERIEICVADGISKKDARQTALEDARERMAR